MLKYLAYLTLAFINFITPAGTYSYSFPPSLQSHVAPSGPSSLLMPEGEFLKHLPILKVVWSVLVQTPNSLPLVDLRGPFVHECSEMPLKFLQKLKVK